jgi:hypothetical protein
VAKIILSLLFIVSAAHGRLSVQGNKIEFENTGYSARFSNPWKLSRSRRILQGLVEIRNPEENFSIYLNESLRTHKGLSKIKIGNFVKDECNQIAKRLKLQKKTVRFKSSKNTCEIKYSLGSTKYYQKLFYVKKTRGKVPDGVFIYALSKNYKMKSATEDNKTMRLIKEVSKRLRGLK